MTYRKRISMFLLPLALLAVGCKSTKKESDLLDSLANLDKETIYKQAEQLYSEKEYQKARDLFSFVYDTFPNDPLGHKAALRVADTYAVKTDVTSLTEARLRYRDFANRYPNDPDRDYALLMVGQTYSARKLRPDRDLSDIQEALAAYQQLINLYPNSQHIGEAEEKVHGLRELLAEHEWLVADFDRRNKYYQGALWRLEYIQENYPNYSQIALVNEQIGGLKTIIDEREAAWKKQLEALKKESED
ncbi:MAG: outer membrane protein assembly factor BamD [Candidatus Aminicenantes bacterium]|nr:MAG: outer membrane protein assembly factor BamD [Candidatus Aminicenantes bacterium]